MRTAAVVRGWGSARIRAEAEMDLRYQVDDGHVTIFAEAPLTAADAPVSVPASRA